MTVLGQNGAAGRTHPLIQESDSSQLAVTHSHYSFEMGTHSSVTLTEVNSQQRSGKHAHLRCNSHPGTQIGVCELPLAQFSTRLFCAGTR